MLQYLRSRHGMITEQAEDNIERLRQTSRVALDEREQTIREWQAANPRGDLLNDFSFGDETDLDLH